tara:strand:+ start:300 stop:563 length:264 start_codon:yes stop_codon:yes gene_type:complete
VIGSGRYRNVILEGTVSNTCVFLTKFWRWYQRIRVKARVRLEQDEAEEVEEVGMEEELEAEELEAEVEEGIMMGEVSQKSFPFKFFL